MIVAQNDSHSAKADQAPLAELDTPDNVLACIEYLAREVDVAVAGEGGRAVTISALHGCMDRGASWGMAAALCFANIKTEGEDWTLQDLRKLSKGLLPSRQNAPGIDSPALAEVEFGAVDVGDTDGAAPAKQTMAAEDFDSIEEDYTAAPNYLIEDWYDQESTVVTYGESNSGKTHVVLAQSIAIASGKPWAGKKVHQGLVVYVAAEGGRGLRRRLKAYKKTQPDLKGVPFALVAYPIALLHSLTDMKALVSLIKAEEAKFGQKCVMVVIDTLSRALAGGDENSSPDMGAFVKRCDGIRFATGATVHVVHHSGKNTAKGARGHSLLRAAVDTEIEIESNTILSRKQRDMEAPQELRFDYKPVLVGVRPDGSEVRSVVLDVWAQTEFTPNTSPQTQKVLEAAQAVVTQKTQIAGAENACSETAMFSVKEIVAFGVPERTAERSAKELVELGGFVKCKRGLYKLG